MRCIALCAVTVFAWTAAVDARILTGEIGSVTVERGDTLRSLGSRFGVDARTLAADNGLSLDKPLPVGMTLRIDNRHVMVPFAPDTSIVINVPQRMLFVAAEGGVVAYPVAVGRADWQTPLGEFSILSKETNPTWDVPESIREEARRAGRSLPLKVPPGPDNPLGAYWLGLSLGSLGIHGTNAPRSIYQVVTHGCIRLHPDDIAALFPQVQVGTTGVLVYLPVLVAMDGDDVFLEVHRDVYGRGPRDVLEFVRLRAHELGVFDRIDWNVAGEVIRQRAGVARRISS